MNNLKLIVEKIPDTPSDCPYAKFYPYAPCFEQTGQYNCQLGGVCNISSNECVHMKTLAAAIVDSFNKTINEFDDKNANEPNNNEDNKPVRKRCQGRDCIYYEIRNITINIVTCEEKTVPYCKLAHKELEINDKDSCYSCAPTNWVVACEECIPTRYL